MATGDLAAGDLAGLVAGDLAAGDLAGLAVAFAVRPVWAGEGSAADFVAEVFRPDWAAVDLGLTGSSATAAADEVGDALGDTNNLS